MFFICEIRFSSDCKWLKCVGSHKRAPYSHLISFIGGIRATSTKRNVDCSVFAAFYTLKWFSFEILVRVCSSFFFEHQEPNRERERQKQEEKTTKRRANMSTRLRVKEKQIERS